MPQNAESPRLPPFIHISLPSSRPSSPITFVTNSFFPFIAFVFVLSIVSSPSSPSRYCSSWQTIKKKRKQLRIHTYFVYILHPQYITSLHIRPLLSSLYPQFNFLLCARICALETILYHPTAAPHPPTWTPKVPQFTFISSYIQWICTTTISGMK